MPGPRPIQRRTGNTVLPSALNAWGLSIVVRAFRGGHLIKENTEEPVQEGQASLHRVRLPGFLLEEESGLGDLIKKATYAMGIPH